MTLERPYYLPSEPRAYPRGGGGRVTPPPLTVVGPRGPAARGGLTTAFAPRAAGLQGDGSQEPTSSEA